MKKQTVITTFLNKDWIFFLLLTLIIVVLFILFVPKVTTTLIPQKRAELLQKLINNTQENHDIDLQGYWEFREFYSPGSFIYEKNGLPDNTTSMALKKLDNSVTPQLLFTSQRVVSVGGRTKRTTFTHVITNDNHVLVNTPSVLFLEHNNIFSLTFFKPVTEMKKANGFLQNTPDHDEAKGDMWLETTTIHQ